MIFKLKELPKVGSIRIVKKFAWFPKTFDRKVLWLGYYYVKQTYVEWQNEYGGYAGQSWNNGKESLDPPNALDANKQDIKKLLKVEPEREMGSLK